MSKIDKLKSIYGADNVTFCDTDDPKWSLSFLVHKPHLSIILHNWSLIAHKDHPMLVWKAGGNYLVMTNVRINATHLEYNNLCIYPIDALIGDTNVDPQ